MLPVANVAIHPSQFPENVRRDLFESLRARKINHKFHYDSVKQTQKWLALHDACSPARNDIDCVETYDKAFGAAADRVASRRVQVISLGCGGGQKDVRLLKLLKAGGKKISYSPCDVSAKKTGPEIYKQLHDQHGPIMVLPEYGENQCEESGITGQPYVGWRDSFGPAQAVDAML